MKRALPLLLLLFLAACSPGKPPAKLAPWGEGDVSFERAARAKSFYCNGATAAAAPLEWSDSSALPGDPSQVLVILDPGHGGPRSGRGTYTVCNGTVQIDEDWVNLALALRMQSFLERAGFQVDLSRYGRYGPFDGGCVSEALLGISDSKVCENAEKELLRRGWNKQIEIRTVEKLCRKHFPTKAEAQACVDNATYFDTDRKKFRSISRYGQIVRRFKEAGKIDVPFNPDGANLVGSPRVALISLHFNSATQAGAMFTSMIRGIGGGGSSILAPNQAVTKGSNPVAAVSRNLVTSALEYMLRSLKDSQALPEAVNKSYLYYWDAGIVRNGAHAQEFDLHGRPGAVFAEKEHMKGKYQKPPRYAGPVTVASGLNPSYDKNDQIKSIATDSTAITIPSTTLIEVGSYVDCENARALRRSLDRASMQKCYNNPPPGTACPPLDPTDPIDVAAEDIAHGLVEYYESYVPGFKAKVCENLKRSDWGQQKWEPRWCKAPDINAVTPDRFEAELRVGEETQATLSFENVGDGDLVYTVSTSSPVADLGPPQVVPAGHARPLDASQGGVLPPGKRAEIPVTLRCSSSGTQTGSVRIESNDPDEPEVEVPISLTCQSAPVLRVRELGAGVTAFNFLLPAGSGWASVANDVLDFWEAGGEDELHYRLTLPGWLELGPAEGVLPPGGHFLDQVASDARANCGPAGEREGVVVIESDDPQNPRVEVPVRLLCAELEVRFDPATYNTPDVPPEARCPPLSGTITVHGAPHLQELYAGPQGYELPAFTYLVEHPNYTTRRWPILHAPGNPGQQWDWSSYPEIPFTSFVLSCSFDKGQHRVKTFDLVHPRWSPNPPNPRSEFGAHLTAPTGFSIADNRFPGVVYDRARSCDNQGHCTEYDVEAVLGGGAGDQRIKVTYDGWDWLLMPLAEPFTEDVTVLDRDTPVQAGHYDLGPFIDARQLRYCRILRTNRLRDHNRNFLDPPGMPPVFWGQTVELDGPDLWVVQAMHQPLCYAPWDPGAGPYPPWRQRAPQRHALPEPSSAGFRLFPSR